MIATKQLLARAHNAVDHLGEPNHLRTAAAATLDRAWTLTADAVRSPQSRRHLLWVVLAVATTTAVMMPVRGALGVLNVLLIFLLLTFVVALALGSGPATLAAILSFLAFNFVFIPPYYTFDIAHSDHVLALFVYLGVAVITGQLVARVRTRTEIAERERRRIGLLYELNAALVGSLTPDAILA